MCAPRRSADPAGLALLALLALAAGPAAAGPRLGPGLDWLVQGLFCAPPEGARLEAPGTIAGWIHVPDAPIEMVAQGAMAPAILGMGFGVWFQRAGTDAMVLRHVVTHPPMTAAGITRQTWESVSEGGQPDAIFFQFDLPEELVPGEWTFQAFAGETELFHVPFTVVPAEQMPEVAGLCRPGTLLSRLAG